jgi:hypothetical protein
MYRVVRNTVNARAGCCSIPGVIVCWFSEHVYVERQEAEPRTCNSVQQYTWKLWQYSFQGLLKVSLGIEDLHNV